jgi:hypothetical protein
MAQFRLRHVPSSQQPSAWCIPSRTGPNSLKCCSKVDTRNSRPKCLGLMSARADKTTCKLGFSGHPRNEIPTPLLDSACSTRARAAPLGNPGLPSPHRTGRPGSEMEIWRYSRISAVRQLDCRASAVRLMYQSQPLTWRSRFCFAFASASCSGSNSGPVSIFRRCLQNLATSCLLSRSSTLVKFEDAVVHASGKLAHCPL